MTRARKRRKLGVLIVNRQGFAGPKIDGGRGVDPAWPASAARREFDALLDACDSAVRKAPAAYERALAVMTQALNADLRLTDVDRQAALLALVDRLGSAMILGEIDRGKADEAIHGLRAGAFDAFLQPESVDRLLRFAEASCLSPETGERRSAPEAQ